MSKPLSTASLDSLNRLFWKMLPSELTFVVSRDAMATGMPIHSLVAENNVARAVVSGEDDPATQFRSLKAHDRLVLRHIEYDLRFAEHRLHFEAIDDALQKWSVVMPQRALVAVFDDAELARLWHLLSGRSSDPTETAPVEMTSLDENYTQGGDYGSFS